MNFSAQQFFLSVTDVEGNVVPRDPNAPAKASDPLTVKQVIRGALSSSFPSFSENENDKYENYELAKKIMSLQPADTIELTAEQIARIKKKVGLGWGSEVMGFVFDVLESKNQNFKVIAGD